MSDNVVDIEKARRRQVALDCVNSLAPEFWSLKRRKFAANRVLTMFGDESQRLTPEAMGELISRHSCCVHDQEGKCPLQLFVRPMCWEINVFFGAGNDEDKGFRRVSEMPAARPLSDHSAEEELE